MRSIVQRNRVRGIFRWLCSRRLSLTPTLSAGALLVASPQAGRGCTSSSRLRTETSEGDWLLRDTLWDRAERLLIGLLGALAMLVGLVQVVGRYVAPRYAISWAEEVIVYLIVWGIMLAASQLVRTDGHVRPDLLLRAVPPHAQRWMEVTNCIAALLFCAGLAWYVEHRRNLLCAR
jgi:hypothetical protein